MTTRIKSFLSCLLVLFPAVSGAAEPHAPLEPTAQVSNLYAWLNPASSALIVVIETTPFLEPSLISVAPRFPEDVLFELHIARGATSLADVVTYQLRFGSPPVVRGDPANLTSPLQGAERSSLVALGEQSVTITRLGGANPVTYGPYPVAPWSAGPNSATALLARPYDDTFAATFVRAAADGTRVWAGPRDEGQYADVGALGDFLSFRARGTAQDGFAGFNTLAIALEIPTVQLTGTGTAPTPGASNAQTLGIWASSSRRKAAVQRADGTRPSTGPWQQISRVGFPLFAELFIGFQDRERFARSHPADDLSQFGAYLLNPVLVREAERTGIYTALGTSATSFKSARVDLIDFLNIKNVPAAGSHNLGLTGNVLRLDMGTPSSFPNGRPIPGAQANAEQTDVVDALLSVILVRSVAVISDGVAYNDRPFLLTMPYLALPWRGLDQGHGKTTP